MSALRFLFQGRFLALTACCTASVIFGLVLIFHPESGWASVFLFALAAGLTLLGLRDISQTGHSVLRNYPILGHLRFLFETIRPEIRQYFFEADTDGVPFSRDKRAIVYQRAKRALDKRPFGTQLDVYAGAYEWVHHSMAPKPLAKEPFRMKRVSFRLWPKQHCRTWRAEILCPPTPQAGASHENRCMTVNPLQCPCKRVRRVSCSFLRSASSGSRSSTSFKKPNVISR